MGLMRNVTAQNFEKLAELFMVSNGDTAFMVCPVPFFVKEQHHGASAREFGAWYAYRKKKGLDAKLMISFAEQAKPWTVPTPWPHEFDAEATFASDEEAGQYFAAHFRRPIPPDPATKDQVERIMKSAGRFKGFALQPQ
jgi:hypothetical protein